MIHFLFAQMPRINGHFYNIRPRQKIQSVQLKLIGPLHLFDQVVSFFHCFNGFKWMLKHKVIACPKHSAFFNCPAGFENILPCFIPMKHLFPNMVRAGLYSHYHLHKPCLFQLFKDLGLNHFRVRPYRKRKCNMLFIFLNKMIHPAGRGRKNFIVKMYIY